MRGIYRSFRAVAAAGVLLLGGFAFAADPATRPAAVPEHIRLGDSGLRSGRPWAFTPDSKGLFTLDGNVIRLWDAATGKPLRSFSAPQQMWVTAVSPDGKLLAGGQWNALIVWDVASGKQKCVIPVAGGLASGVTFNANSKTMAWVSANAESVVVWDVAQNKAIATFPNQEKDGHPGVVALSPDGSTLVEGGGGVVFDNNKVPRGFSTIRIWDIAGKKLKAYEKMDVAGAANFVFLPDGKRLVAGGQQLVMWDVAAGKKLSTIPPDGTTYASFAITANGKSLTALAVGPIGDGQVARFNIGDTELKPTTVSAMNHILAVLSPDGTLGAYGNTAAKVVDTTTGKPTGVDSGPTSMTLATAFVGDGKSVVTVSDDGNAYLWEAATGKLQKSIVLGISHVVGASVSADGTTLIATDDMRIYGFDLDSGTPLFNARPQIGRRVSIAAISADGKRVAATGRLFDMQMHWGLFVWGSRTGGAPRVERSAPTFFGGGICWSPDGETIAMGCSDGKVRLFRSSDGVDQKTLKLPGPEEAEAPGAIARRTTEKSIVAVDISPDGRVLAATLAGGDLAWWDTGSGKLLRHLPKANPAAARVRFDPRGFAVATLDQSGVITYWEIATGIVIAKLDSGRPSLCWNMSSNGQYLITGADPSSNVIWRSPLGGPATRPSALAAGDEQQFDKLWADLAGHDAVLAYRAADDLVAAGGPAVKYLAAHLTWPAPSAQVRAKMSALVEGLSADDFKTRAESERKIRELGGASHPLLVEALKNPESIDARLAIQRIINEEIAADDLSPDDTRAIRAISALERIGSPDAIGLLQAIWNTTTSERAAADSRAALNRLQAKKKSGNAEP